MATAIKPKQKLKLDWSNDKITKISLNSNELVYVELDDHFYNKTNERFLKIKIIILFEKIYIK